MLPFLLAAPVLAALGFFIISKQVCWKEFLVMLGAVLLINVLGVVFSFMGATYDTELMNGSVTGKKQVEVSCSHSYDCNCRQECTTSRDSQGNTTEDCQEVCDTCYEHDHDYDWDVFTDIGTITIDRVDRQGVDEPPRWTAVIIGEPASKPHTFTNYIKAAPGSVLTTKGNTATFAGLLPAYPKVYDYYRVRRVVPVGVSLPNIDAMNLGLCKIAGVIGPAKQANPIVVVVKTGDQAYTYALTEHWLGGKKNDIILVVGTDDGRSIAWASVISWSDVELLKVVMRDEVVALGTLDKLHPWIESRFTGLVGQHFKRKPMADFEYLRYQYSPSPGVMFFLLFLGLAACIGLGVYFMANDPFETGIRRHRWQRY